MSATAKTRQKSALNRSLHGVNEDKEPIFNAVLASAIAKQRPVKDDEEVVAVANLNPGKTTGIN
jgi:hypothetical protein